MKYKLKKETKPTLTTFGKYKAVTVHTQTIETSQILKEVCENNPISEGTVTAVVWKLEIGRASCRERVCRMV